MAFSHGVILVVESNALLLLSVFIRYNLLSLVVAEHHCIVFYNKLNTLTIGIQN